MLSGLCAARTAQAEPQSCRSRCVCSSWLCCSFVPALLPAAACPSHPAALCGGKGWRMGGQAQAPSAHLCLLHHAQLRQHRHRLEVHAEGPQDLQGGTGAAAGGFLFRRPAGT